MKYGLMDGWMGDEFECHGYCGGCDECIQNQEQRDEAQYESFRDQEYLL
jgi:hypothetical protein